MEHPSLDIQTLFDNQLPDAMAAPLFTQIKNICQSNNIRIVVLDDDPTGTQTVHGIPVITNWREDLIRQTMRTSPKGFFILTNTRSVSETEAVAINFLIASRIKKISEQIRCGVLMISRGDSTLRGHFPAETIALDEGTGHSYNKYILMPYFKEGGRYTIDNIHYLLEEKKLIPVAQTSFAKDKSFGYSSSDLRFYIEEKTAGRVNHTEVKSISLEQLKAGSSETETQLEQINEGEYAVVNATCAYHGAIFALSLLQQWEKGKKYLVRCSASLVQALFGISELKILDSSVFGLKDNTGGLIIAGSYISKSTEQLEHLISHTDIIPIEINAQKILDRQAAEYIDEISGQANENLPKGKSVLLYTSRKLIAGDHSDAGLEIGRIISDALVNIVKQIQSKPKFIVAKGGITSSDIATKSLNIQQAEIAGQLLPGIPVWIQGPEAKFPGMPYIIFPGNVGTPDYMTILFKKLIAA